jgi:hypothetical protein
MVLPVEIARAIHERCEKTYIPLKLSIPHEYVAHLETSGEYAKAINAETGLTKFNIDGKAVVTAILMATEWDERSKWPGHPTPKLVIEKLWMMCSPE